MGLFRPILGYWTSWELFRTRRRADSRVGGSLSDLRGKGNAARGIRFMSLSYILGISAYYHDSAACLIGDGDIIAAASEERFTREKGDPAFPTRAVEYCLREAGIRVEDLQYVGFYDKPLLKFERILETYLGVVPRGFKSFLMAGPLWIKDKLYIDRQLKEQLG